MGARRSSRERRTDDLVGLGPGGARSKVERCLGDVAESVGAKEDAELGGQRGMTLSEPSSAQVVWMRRYCGRNLALIPKRLVRPQVVLLRLRLRHARNGTRGRLKRDGISFEDIDASETWILRPTSPMEVTRLRAAVRLQSHQNKRCTRSG